MPDALIRWSSGGQSEPPAQTWYSLDPDEAEGQTEDKLGGKPCTWNNMDCMRVQGQGSLYIWAPLSLHTHSFKGAPFP